MMSAQDLPDLLLLLLLVGLLAFTIPWLEREWRQFYFNRVIWRNRISRQHYLAYDRFFGDKMSWYRNLDEKGRARFIYRVTRYIEAWEFEGREGLEVDLKMKLLVSGAAAQLTYGFTNFYLPNFNKVILFPETFYSKLIQADVKGLTYARGVVALSWKDFEEGYRVDSDKLNLGLHEMAHALDLNYTVGGNGDKALRYYFDHFIDEFYGQFKRLHELGEPYLRERAASNPKEFFAICVEHFFEAPEEFKQKLPDTFNHLSALLQQDPLNQHDNYRLTQETLDEGTRWGRLPIPAGYKFLRKGTITASILLFTLNIPAGFVFLVQYLGRNPEMAGTILISLGCGSAVFFIIRAGAGFLISRTGSAQASVMSLIQGFALSLTALYLLGNVILSREVRAQHPVNGVFSIDYLRYLSLGDGAYLPLAYRMVSKYLYFYQNDSLPDASEHPAVLVEHSTRGCFGLLEKMHSLDLEIDGKIYPYRFSEQEPERVRVKTETLDTVIYLPGDIEIQLLPSKDQ